VFLDFRQVQGHQYAQLAAQLNGRGVPSIDEAFRELVLEPVLGPFRELVNADLFRRVRESASQPTSDALLDEIEYKTARLLQAAAQIVNPQQPVSGLQSPSPSLAPELCLKLESLLRIHTLPDRFPMPRSRKYKWGIDYLTAGLASDPASWPTLLGWLSVHLLGKVTGELDYERTSRAWIDEWLLDRVVAGVLHGLGVDVGTAWHRVLLIKLLTSHQRWFEIETSKTKRARDILRLWLDDDDVTRFLQVNRHNDVLWFNKEAFEQLLWGMFAVATIAISADPSRPANRIAEEIVACYDVVRALQRAQNASEYRVEKLMEVA
jgi:hypothetical protein